jgi:hypothetical protein
MEVLAEAPYTRAETEPQANWGTLLVVDRRKNRVRKNEEELDTEAGFWN